MLGQPSNPMLAQAEQAVQAKVKPNLQPQLAKIIQAGLTILYSPSLKVTLMHRINTSNNPAQDAGQGSARMMAELYKQSNKTLPVPLMIPAAMILAFEYLDLVAKAGKAQITPQLIAHTAQAVSSAMMVGLGITPAKLHQMMAQGAQPSAAPAVPQPAPRQGIIASQLGA